YWKCPIFDDDYDEEYTIQVREYYKNSPVAITRDSPITDSLIIEDEHLDTIPERESYEENNSSVEDLNLTPSESEDLSDIEKSDLIESLLNKNTVITSPKIDFLLEEFAGELALTNPIPPRIVETNFDPKEDIRLIKNASTTIHIDISLPEYESFGDESDSASEIFNDDLAHIISPSEYEYVYADDEFDSGDLTTYMVEDISGDSTRKLQMSHQGFKTLKISQNFFNISPMMINGEDIPIWDVLYLHFYPP
ncbi:hypothetical protein Tco_1488779, partial [Tanacetum coccineum]